MLEMGGLRMLRRSLERAAEAFICSYECTFRTCALPVRGRPLSELRR